MLEAYVSFLNSTNAWLGPRRQTHGSRRISGLPGQFEGIENLVNSFNTGSPHDKIKNIEEWNPFSQRPIFEVDHKISKSLSYDFDYVADIAQRFVILAHEAMHVLLWEPFFCGHFKPNRANFRDLSLAFEGFCFWYAEIVVNEKLKFQFPDGERVFDRCSVSQISTHPKSAFKILNVTDPRKIMQIYTHAFRGYETKFSQRSTDPIVLNLAQRFYSFYDATVRAPNGMFEAFKELGLFGEFYSRFCRVRDLPSLLSDPLLRFPISSDIDAYCWKMYAEGMKHVAQMSHEQVLSVRARRAIQTRAYYAYCLKHTIESGNFSGGAKFPSARTLKNINAYITTLESAINILRRDQLQSMRQVRIADEVFEHDVRLPLKRHRVFISARSQLVPELAGHSMLKVNENRSSLSPSQLSAFAKALLQTYVQSTLAFKDNARSSQDLAEITLRILKLTNKIADSKKREQRERWAQLLSSEIDVLLKHELVFREWSLPLALIDPLRNSFREILFIYQ